MPQCFTWHVHYIFMHSLLGSKKKGGVTSCLLQFIFESDVDRWTRGLFKCDREPLLIVTKQRPFRHETRTLRSRWYPA